MNQEQNICAFCKQSKLVLRRYVHAGNKDLDDNKQGTFKIVNYCRDNCRWATKLIQVGNRRLSIWVEIDGIRKTLTDWCRINGLDPQRAYHRIWRGKWDPVKAVSIPPMIKNVKRGPGKYGPNRQLNGGLGKGPTLLSPTPKAEEGGEGNQ